MLDTAGNKKAPIAELIHVLNKMRSTNESTRPTLHEVWTALAKPSTVSATFISAILGNLSSSSVYESIDAKSFSRTKRLASQIWTLRKFLSRPLLI